MLKLSQKESLCVSHPMMMPMISQIRMPMPTFLPILVLLWSHCIVDLLFQLEILLAGAGFLRPSVIPYGLDDASSHPEWDAGAQPHIETLMLHVEESKNCADDHEDQDAITDVDPHPVVLALRLHIRSPFQRKCSMMPMVCARCQDCNTPKMAKRQDLAEGCENADKALIFGGEISTDTGEWSKKDSE